MKATAGFLFPAIMALAAKVATVPTPVQQGEAGKGAGPIATSLPDDAVVARTEEELARLLSEPAGPAKIGLLRRTYHGNVVIRRKVELVGQRGTVLDAGGAGTVVTIDAEGVVVRDVAIRHSGRRETAEDAGVRAHGKHVRIEHASVDDTLFGISFEECSACVLEAVRVTGLPDPIDRGDGIKLWESDDAIVRNCAVEDSRDIVVWYSRRALLERNFVTRSRYGTHFMYAHDSIVRDSNVVGNVVGVFVMYSNRIRIEDSVLAGARGPAGMGIGFKESDTVELRGNWIVANTVGAYLDGTPRSPNARVRFLNDVMALNDVGLRFHGSERGVDLFWNDFQENATMVEVEGGGDALGAEFRDNYFSDYTGYDLDGDGVGDVAYEEKILSNVLTDAHPVLRFFQGTLAMGLIDELSRVVPVFATRTMLTDPSPRMHPGKVLVR